MDVIVVAAGSIVKFALLEQGADWAKAIPPDAFQPRWH